MTVLTLQRDRRSRLRSKAEPAKLTRLPLCWLDSLPLGTETPREAAVPEACGGAPAAAQLSPAGDGHPCDVEQSPRLDLPGS